MYILFYLPEKAILFGHVWKKLIWLIELQSKYHYSLKCQPLLLFPSLIPEVGAKVKYKNLGFQRLLAWHMKIRKYSKNNYRILNYIYLNKLELWLVMNLQIQDTWTIVLLCVLLQIRSGNNTRSPITEIQGMYSDLKGYLKN